MPRFNTHLTPNPNSLKITTDAGDFIESGMESFSTVEEAARHPLGKLLFAIRGMANIFVLPQFVTITKTPSADWDEMLPLVDRALDAYFENR
ncbi:MAG: NifU N-terminal domain-containing protein [Rhodothermales bacterium]